jgi:hypothetical protein
LTPYPQPYPMKKSKKSNPSINTALTTLIISGFLIGLALTQSTLVMVLLATGLVLLYARLLKTSD